MAKAIPDQSKMSAEHRSKIGNSNILKHLIEHAEGDRDMTQSQVTAGIALLKKVLPDLRQTEHGGKDGGAIVHEFTIRFVE